MRRHTAGFLDFAPDVFGVEKRDATRVPLYKFD
jgi:hypothetical protein